MSTCHRLAFHVDGDGVEIVINLLGLNVSDLQRICRSWRVDVLQQGDGGCDATIIVQSRAAGRLGPPQGSQRRQFPGEEAWIGDGSNILYYHRNDQSAEMLVDLNRYEAIVCGPSPLGYVDGSFSLLLGRLLGRRNLVLAHAGAILFEDSCILVFGESGRGKSSLIAHFLAVCPRSRLVGDDVVLLGAKEDGQIQVAPARSGLGISTWLRDELGLQFAHFEAAKDDPTRDRVWMVLPEHRLSPKRFTKVQGALVPAVWWNEDTQTSNVTDEIAAPLIAESIMGARIFVDHITHDRLTRALLGLLKTRGAEINMGKDLAAVRRKLNNALQGILKS